MRFLPLHRSTSMMKVIVPHYDPVLYLNSPKSRTNSSSTASDLDVNSNPMGSKNFVFPIKFIYSPILIDGVLQEPPIITSCNVKIFNY